MWTYSSCSPALARAPPRPPSIATPPPSHHSPWPLLEARQSMSCQIQKDPSLLFLTSVKVSYRELQFTFYYLIIFMNQPNIANSVRHSLTPHIFVQVILFCEFFWGKVIAATYESRSSHCNENQNIVVVIE